MHRERFGAHAVDSVEVGLSGYFLPESTIGGVCGETMCHQKGLIRRGLKGPVFGGDEEAC